MSEELHKKLQKEGINRGLILGGILGVLGILSFYFMINMATSMVAVIIGPLFLSVIIPIVISVFFCLNMRKAIGGYWDFKQAVRGIFIMFISAYVISYLISSVLFTKIIEPNAIDKTEAAMVNVTTTMLEKTKAEQSDIDKQMEKVHQQFEEQRNISVGKQIQSVVIGIIFVFVFSLIFAAIFKKERPLYLNDTDGIDPTIIN